MAINNPAPIQGPIQATAQEPLLTILHISDLHFGPPFVVRVAEALLESAKKINPQVVVISGDLTQRATRDQFLAAKEFLGRLPQVPQLVIPGNHDVPLYRVVERLRNPLHLYKEIINEDPNPVLNLPQALIVGVDSTAPQLAITNGRIHRWQLEHCEQAFRGATDQQVKIVVAHHHFAPAHDVLRDWQMPQSKRAINRFEELGVDLILGGHLHRAYIGNTLDFYPGKDRDRGIIIVQSGTSTSRRGRGREKEKNSFNMIRIFSDIIGIEHHHFFDDQQGFVPTSWHRFLRT